MSQHAKMYLNNYLQARHGTTKCLTWEEAQLGPQHSGHWMAVAYFNNIEYGRGRGVTKSEAADNAAEQALRALRGY